MARGDAIQSPPNIAALQRDMARVRESVEKLAGERGDDTFPLSAIRRTELRPLASLTLRSKQATAAPTQAQFNALQADVKDIFDALARISNVLGNAVIPRI